MIVTEVLAVATQVLPGGQASSLSLAFQKKQMLRPHFCCLQGWPLLSSGPQQLGLDPRSKRKPPALGKNAISSLHNNA